MRRFLLVLNGLTFQYGSLMKKRIYLDYNATAPLSQSFRQALAEGSVPEGNASSTHTSGKQVAKYIEDTKDSIFSHFNLDKANYDLFFHSGATEAANTFFQLKKGDLFCYFSTDHACIRAQVPKLEANGVEIVEIPVGKNGEIRADEVIELLKVKDAHNKPTYLHFTWMNNETGVVQNLSIAEEIKKQTGCSVYVDAVQVPGRVSGYQTLSESLDVYTFSGHKFGALKGIGFSFVSKDFDFKPLIGGGGQQNNLRSGTVNSHGIASLHYALAELKSSNKNLEKLKELKEEIARLLSENDKIIVFLNESTNTISFIHKEKKADVMLIHFDMAGLEVSSGSACSSGSIEPSNVINAMGYDKYALNNIRISLGVDNLSDRELILDRLTLILSKL